MESTFKKGLDPVEIQERKAREHTQTIMKYNSTAYGKAQEWLKTLRIHNGKSGSIYQNRGRECYAHYAECLKNELKKQGHNIIKLPEW